MQNLADLERAIGRYTSIVPRLADWDEAIDALLRLGATGSQPTVVAIDEVGYLIDAEPSFASRLQAALSPASTRARPHRVRLILCGSAFGQMRDLVDHDAPLRGRTQLELVIHPFRFAEAAEYWRLTDNPDVAFRLHSLVGGTPAYREYVGGIGPRRRLPLQARS